MSLVVKWWGCVDVIGGGALSSLGLRCRRGCNALLVGLLLAVV